MKTKRVEVKGFIPRGWVVNPQWGKVWQAEFVKDPTDFYSVPATLTFDIPAPEKSVTITESQFDRALEELTKYPLIGAPSMVATKIKNPSFREWR